MIVGISDSLTPKQKAAQVIISLGADVASSIYKHLQEEEIEKLTYEITRQESVRPEISDQAIDEFYGLCVAQKVYLEGGIAYAKNVLEKAFGVQQGNALLERVTKTLRTKAFEFIRKADYKTYEHDCERTSTDDRSDFILCQSRSGVLNHR